VIGPELEFAPLQDVPDMPDGSDSGEGAPGQTLTISILQELASKKKNPMVATARTLVPAALKRRGYWRHPWPGHLQPRSPVLAGKVTEVRGEFSDGSQVPLLSGRSKVLKSAVTSGL
jgi:hypothetical protein